MNNTNGFISGDNKGLASHLFEMDMNPGVLPSQVKFIAAFAQANEGDVSPNTRGPHCLDTGLPCDVQHSTCNNRVSGAGPSHKNASILHPFSCYCRLLNLAIDQPQAL